MGLAVVLLHVAIYKNIVWDHTWELLQIHQLIYVLTQLDPLIMFFLNTLYINTILKNIVYGLSMYLGIECHMRFTIPHISL